MSTTALPPAARTRKRLKQEHETHTSQLESNSTSSSASVSDSDKEFTNSTEASTAEPLETSDLIDFVGSLIQKPGSPSLGNDFLTAHHIFGDYVRKHEIPRKVLHSSIGFITLYLYTKGVQTDVFPLPFAISFVVIFALDLLRFKSRRFNYAYCQVVGFLMREKEIQSYNGVLWYILGLAFSFYFMPKDIVLISVLLLSWSDTAASTCGRKWGYLTPKLSRNKSLAGSIAAFVIGVICSYLLYGYFIPKYSYLNAPGSIFWTPESSKINIHILSFLMGFVASFSEGIDLFNWDDNFTIPVLSGLFAYGVISLFHV